MLNKKKGGAKMKIQKVGDSFELKGMDRFQAKHLHHLLEYGLMGEVEYVTKVAKVLNDLDKLASEFEKLLDKRV